MGLESHFILMGMSAQNQPMPSAIREARWGPICTPSPGFFRSYPASSRSPNILQTQVIFSICLSNLACGLILVEPAGKEHKVRQRMIAVIAVILLKCGFNTANEC